MALDLKTEALASAAAVLIGGADALAQNRFPRARGSSAWTATA